MSDRSQFPRRFVFRGALSAAALTSLAACTDTSTASSSNTEAGATYGSGWSEPATPVVAPLTGLTSDSSTLTGPALAVKIPNDDYGARPQINLNHADQVYEELVEGGYTRYVGIFHSDIPNIIGPLRSFRPMDPAIMHPYNPIVVFSGGQAPFVRLLQRTGLTFFRENNGGEYLYRLSDSRAPEKVAPDNLILRAKKIWKANKSAPAPSQIFNYSTGLSDSTAVARGTSVKKLSITMSSYTDSAWTWNSETQLWQRSQWGEKDVQYNESFVTSRVTTTNIVIIRVDVDRSKYASLHGSPPYTHLFGSGKAYVASGGKIIKATWSKGKTTSSPLTLKTTDGLPLRLAPGRTWFNLVPNDYGDFGYK